MIVIGVFVLLYFNIITVFESLKLQETQKVS